MHRYVTLAIAICFILFLEKPLYSNEESEQRLLSLESQLRKDLKDIQIPPRCWLLQKKNDKEVIDVAVIGGGMAGLSAGFALIQQGITNIKIYDENQPGEEGPWRKYARMEYLRSSKALMGPSLGIPGLTFRSWYEAKYGIGAWQELQMVPTECWADYLAWYCKVLCLPICNKMRLKDIIPMEDCLGLVFETHGESILVLTRKVVLATGREGFGGGELPEYAHHVPKQFYAHSTERIDGASLKDKRIVVIGAGASAFDAAAFALENGAFKVEMLVRRNLLPTINKFGKLTFPGMQHGFCELSDEMRCQFFIEASSCGNPPPKSAIERVKDYKNLNIRFNICVEDVEALKYGIVLHTSQGEIEGDFIIFATGYGVDGRKRPELRKFIDYILLWKDKLTGQTLLSQQKLGEFPYLGRHFQFLEKGDGQCPALRNVYCFNYGAYLSHGLISGDIAGIGVGARRLAEGIAADFFNEDAEKYLQWIKSYNIPLFKSEDYEILHQ